MMSESDVLILDQDVEQGRNTQPDQGKPDLYDIKELFSLLEKGHWRDENRWEKNIEEIGRTLKKNKLLLTARYIWKTLIHAAKYNKLDFECKIKIINAIVDIGFELFEFSLDSPTGNNFRALFFSAAKGDYEKLKEIVNYFKNHDATRIYDTLYEGDTVLSFMIKFGDYFQDDFLNCFKLMVQEHIDVERVDYFNKNISKVIKTEEDFLEKIRCDDEAYIIKLNEMKEIINAYSGESHLNSEISGKYEIFQALIEKSDNFSKLLTSDLVDADDGENTLLQLAVIKSNLKITKELLEKNANPNRVTEFGNEKPPLVLAAKLGRIDIFKEILKNKNINITSDVFSTFVREIDSKFFNFLLEADTLNINVEYNGKTPLFYVICKKNKTAVQSLLRKGSRVTEIHLQNINPRDLENYLNYCVRDDTYTGRTDETQYKPLLVFDFFLNSGEYGSDSKKITTRFDTEVAIIQSIGENKRLRHLLEHPLVYIFIILKWHCVKLYYIYFLLLKAIFYIITDILLYTETFNVIGAFFVLLIQSSVVSYNFREFKWEYKKYTLHYVIEILILSFLIAVYILTFLTFIANYIHIIFSIRSLHLNLIHDIIVQLSAVIIILTSLSILLTIGYHFSLSKWMAMAKRVFKNFASILLFFLIPITGFATSFRLLNSLEKNQDSQNEKSDFDYLPRAIFRTLIMLGGDIGDKKFSAVGGYVIFIFFTIVMAIILLNFWTGVAVSDIKEIEEQSTVVAFQNVIVFIESVESMYKFFWTKVIRNRLFPNKLKEVVKNNQPFLETKLYSKENGKSKFHYSLDFYINSSPQFTNPYFKKCKIPNVIISKMKSFLEEKDVTTGKCFKDLNVKLESLESRLAKIEQLLQSHLIRDDKYKRKKN